jgi:hypothetical protein
MNAFAFRIPCFDFRNIFPEGNKLNPDDFKGKQLSKREVDLFDKQEMLGELNRMQQNNAEADFEVDTNLHERGMDTMDWDLLQTYVCTN